MRDQTLGIDISNNRISLALMSQTDSGIELLKSAYGPMPEGAIVDGNIKNAQILAKAVKELCSRNKIPTHHAVVSLIAKPAIIRIMDLPKDMPGNPAQYVRDELKHYAVMSGKTIMHDFCAIAPQKKTRTTRLLLAAADEDKITDLIKAFNRVGINVKAVEPGAISCIRLLHANCIAKQFHSNVLIAVVQDTTTTLCVFSAANLDFVHTVEIGESDLENEQGVQSLLTEIHAIKQFYDVEIEDVPEKWEVIVAFSCNDPEYENLRQNLQSGLTGTTIRISSPATLCENSQLKAKDPTNNVSPISAGLAMKYFKMGSADLKINLLPAGADEIHNMQKFALTAGNIIIVAFLVSLLAVPVLRIKLIGANQAITEYKQKQSAESTEKLFVETAVLDQKITTLTGKLKSLATIADSSSSSRNWAKLIADVGGRIPQNVRITNLTAKDANIQLAGQALSYDQINKFVKQLSKSPYIASATLVKSEIDPLTRDMLLYNINCSFAADKRGANAD